MADITIYYDWDESWEPKYQSEKDKYGYYQPIEVPVNLWDEYLMAARAYHALKAQLDTIVLQVENGEENNSN